MDKLYSVGAYIRLSKESKAYTKDESLSIENQQAMLSKFIAIMPGWVEKRFYIDDGYTGGNFQRPAFLQMMEDVKSGFINLVLVKDLPRFGRNYLETGRYLEEELPALDCRFVSLAEGIDTEDGENDILPFLNAMNDYYLKNLSDRIKTVLQAKAKDGQFLSGAVPYGYVRSEADHNRIVVDCYTAEVVQKVFALRVGGLGYTKIAATLNADNIVPPRLYYYQRQNREPPTTCTKLWQAPTVKALLRGEIYLGHTVQNKTGTRSYRDSSIVCKDEADWIRVENTHESLVDIATWEKVRELDEQARNRAKSVQRTPQKSLFSKLLVCAGCGGSLV